MEQKKECPSKTAGANLKRLIKSSAYATQENFAFVFGTDVRTVRRWIKNGIKNLDTVEQIADFFDVDVLSILSQ